LGPCAPGSGDWSEPGFWFAGNGRGDNEITGYFNVLEISYGPNYELASFAVDFVQNDENGYLGQSIGSLRFNSDIPLRGTLSAPEPTTLALLCAALGAITWVTRNRPARRDF